ncbi:DMT family transporter (plasmid) [Cereibacter azotoformans]|uniref:aromatic amino acid exporter YddG n=1 Tax=Cereibacter azotoformans TaxID=43057 RepID=UPI000E3582C3|nr:DMT family transporter [Cereibacter azotoformans]AXQ96067.1 DMT family transporter [Cereibacter sphaeroides]UIJ32904.1 DMT family transporter [Cereibacter azotoformans]
MASSLSSAIHQATEARRAGVATAVGLVAIGFWSALALLTVLAAGLPPFQLLSLSFGVAFVLSVLLLGLRGKGSFRVWRQPWGVWAFGFIGIFAYHALYFTALSKAPAAQASLIAYLWPLLIVILSTLSRREAFSPRHLVGATLGFAGSALVILGPDGSPTGGAFPLAGYAAAAAGALVWSSYSVFNRRFRHVPSEFIGGVCGLVSIAGLGAHLALETTVMPDATQWAAILLLGAGPVGLAFFAWDHATKHGYLPLLGALSYLAPLLSTLLLLLFGLTPMSWSIIAAATLIVLGAAIAAFGLRVRNIR